MEKALREAKRTTSWVEPDEAHERAVREAVARVVESPPDGFEELAARVAELGRTISLGMTLLKLTVPGVPDVYQGDELEALSLVDPDNRRPVDFERRRRLLAEVRRGAAPTAEAAKLEVVVRALDLRRRRPEDFDGAYEPMDGGPSVCAFRRGDGVVVIVPLRPGAAKEPEAREGWRDLLPSLPVGLYERLS
jgi:(1->4)-alpha-D-glucan 1-alpha-D-glucosylmutase